MDRIFVMTGGSCYNIPAKAGNYPKMDFTVQGLTSADDVYWSREITSRQCRSIRGQWYGGHDPSGHVYLLTLSCSFLVGEVFTFFSAADLVQRYRQLTSEAGRLVAEGKYIELVKYVFSNDACLILALLVVLWYWMLLMTSIHFHSVLEKLAGLLFSLAATIAAEYIAPR